MTPRPFEVGDRVIVKQNAYHGWGVGKTGEIVEIKVGEGLSPKIYIHFDNGAGEEVLTSPSIRPATLKDLPFYSNELDLDLFLQCCYEALQDVGVENNPTQPLDIPPRGGVG